MACESICSRLSRRTWFPPIPQPTRPNLRPNWIEIGSLALTGKAPGGIFQSGMGVDVTKANGRSVQLQFYYMVGQGFGAMIAA